MPASNPPTDDPASKPPPWCRDHRGREYSFDEFLKRIESFHGYPAPGVLVGAKMVDIAMRRMPAGILFDAVCESAKCLPDAVQLLTPCTMGNGWLRVVPLDRCALTLFDKRNGRGIRVYVSPTRLEAYPETRYWFFGIKPKRKDKSGLLVQEIRRARDTLYGFREVRVKPEFLQKAPSAPRAVCPQCGEAYPADHGRICRGCRNETGYLLKEESK
jgi:formylmethanofuran dehydrogenase subunit E